MRELLAEDTKNKGVNYIRQLTAYLRCNGVIIAFESEETK